MELLLILRALETSAPDTVFLSGCRNKRHRGAGHAPSLPLGKGSSRDTGSAGVETNLQSCRSFGPKHEFLTMRSAGPLGSTARCPMRPPEAAAPTLHAAGTVGVEAAL